ncbi:hypothetical protein [Sphingomonas phyllosphaerae]|nr:hypothetical protein [Sphingomonas phyllosphaerae]
MPFRRGYRPAIPTRRSAPAHELTMPARRDVVMPSLDIVLPADDRFARD